MGGGDLAVVAQVEAVQEDRSLKHDLVPEVQRRRPSVMERNDADLLQEREQVPPTHPNQMTLTQTEKIRA